MNYGDVYLNGILEDYKKRLKEQKQELKRMPEGELICRVQKGRIQYMREVWDRAEKTQNRKGITKNQDMINRLARKKYLEISNRLLTEEIEAIGAFLQSHVEPSASNVLSRMPRAYRELPEKCFFPDRRRADAWANAPYEQNPSYPEQKIHKTNKGLWVRSKSELIIAEKLDSYGIPYRYDAVIYYRGHTLSPDFTFMTANGLIYWEHCGLMGQAKYRNHNKWKLSVYEQMGIVPWNNLIITYDTEDGGLSSGIIDAEIHNKLMQ